MVAAPDRVRHSRRGLHLDQRVEPLGKGEVKVRFGRATHTVGLLGVSVPPGAASQREVSAAGADLTADGLELPRVINQPTAAVQGNIANP